MTRAYPLTSDIPPPKRKRSIFDVGSLGLKDMAVGHSLLIEPDKLPRNAKGEFLTSLVGQRIHMAAKRLGLKVRVGKRLLKRDQERGIRVWRIK